jgi:hypothetical protein
MQVRGLALETPLPPIERMTIWELAVCFVLLFGAIGLVLFGIFHALVWVAVHVLI